MPYAGPTRCRGADPLVAEAGTLTGAPKNPNKAFRLFVFESMRSSPNDRVPTVGSAGSSRREAVVDFGLPRTTI
jgi:hypothetical protein